MREIGSLTNNVASACNELVHSKVVTVADRQEALYFNMAHLLVHVKTGLNVKRFSVTCGVTAALPLSFQSTHDSWQYCTNVKSHYRK